MFLAFKAHFLSYWAKGRILVVQTCIVCQLNFLCTVITEPLSQTTEIFRDQNWLDGEVWEEEEEQ